MMDSSRIEGRWFCSRMFIYKGLGHGVFEEAKDFNDKVYEFCVS